MAFTPEDGSGLPDSNSYITVQEFKDFHLDRGTITDGEYTDEQIEQGAVNSTDYLDKRFGRNFRGFRESESQALEWPRINAFDNDDYLLNGPDEIPRNLKKACAEYALIVLQLMRNLAPIPTPEYATLGTDGVSNAQAAGRVTSIREKVGPIETENKFESSESSSNRAPTVKMSSIVGNIPEYPQADLWVEELLTNITSRSLVRGS